MLHITLNPLCPQWSMVLVASCFGDDICKQNWEHSCCFHQIWLSLGSLSIFCWSIIIKSQLNTLRKNREIFFLWLFHELQNSYVLNGPNLHYLSHLACASMCLDAAVSRSATVAVRSVLRFHERRADHRGRPPRGLGLLRLPGHQRGRKCADQGSAGGGRRYVFDPQGHIARFALHYHLIR